MCREKVLLANELFLLIILIFLKFLYFRRREMFTMDEHEGTYDFPMKTLDSSTQTTKLNKSQLLHKELHEVPPKISKSNLVAAKEIKKNSSDKTDHQSLL